MMERTLMALAAAAAIAAAAAVGVIALAFALYAALLPLIGPAWAACAVAGSAALLVAVAAFLAARKAEGGRHHHQAAAAQPEASLIETVMHIVKERPLLSAGAAVAAGLYALRNPQLAATVLRAFMDKPSNKI